MDRRLFCVRTCADQTITSVTNRTPHHKPYICLTHLDQLLEAELSSSIFALGRTVLTQEEGICMGPPASPGLAIVVVAWIRSGTAPVPCAMQHNTLITQYMDDVLSAARTQDMSALTQNLQAYKMDLETEMANTDYNPTSGFQYLQFHVKLQPHVQIRYKPRDKQRWIVYNNGVNTGRYIRWALGQLCAIIDICLSRRDISRSLTMTMRTWAQRQWPDTVIRAAIRWAVKKRLAGAEAGWIRLFQHCWHQAKTWYRNHRNTTNSMNIVCKHDHTIIHSP